MKAARLLQCLVYLSASIVFGSVTLQTIAMGARGAPVYAIEYVAMVGALALFLAAFISVASPRDGQILAIAAILALSTAWVPFTTNLVPRRDIPVSPFVTATVFCYFAVAAFALLYPVRRRWSLPVFGLLVAAGAALGVVTAVRLARSGNLSWPAW